MQIVGAGATPASACPNDGGAEGVIQIQPHKERMTGISIPEPLSNDSEDVRWALTTAQSLLARGEAVEALRWLRRAAETAGDEGDDARHLMLIKAAAEAKTLLGSLQPPSMPPPSSSGMATPIDPQPAGATAPRPGRTRTPSRGARRASQTGKNPRVRPAQAAALVLDEPTQDVLGPGDPSDDTQLTLSTGAHPAPTPSSPTLVEGVPVAGGATAPPPTPESQRPSTTGPFTVSNPDIARTPRSGAPPAAPSSRFPAMPAPSPSNPGTSAGPALASLPAFQVAVIRGERNEARIVPLRRGSEVPKGALTALLVPQNEADAMALSKWLTGKGS